MMTKDKEIKRLRERHKMAYISEAAKAAATIILDCDSFDDINLLGREGIEMVIQDAIEADAGPNKFG